MRGRRLAASPAPVCGRRGGAAGPDAAGAPFATSATDTQAGEAPRQVQDDGLQWTGALDADAVDVSGIPFSYFGEGSSVGAVTSEGKSVSHNGGKPVVATVYT